MGEKLAKLEALTKMRVPENNRRRHGSPEASRLKGALDSMMRRATRMCKYTTNIRNYNDVMPSAKK